MLCSDLEMIKILVESGANVNVKDVYGWTPLASVYTKDSSIVGQEEVDETGGGKYCPDPCVGG